MSAFNYDMYGFDGKWRVRIQALDNESPYLLPWLALTTMIVEFNEPAPGQDNVIRFNGTLDDEWFVVDKEESWLSDRRQARERIDP